MAFTNEVKLIFQDVAKGLLSIPFPPAPAKARYIQLHYCPECDAYHRVPDQPSPYPPSGERIDRLRLHWCPECKHYHRVPDTV